MSKSAFSQYLKHSQLPHKYHLYSLHTVIQHIKEYHLQSPTVTQYDYLSPCTWTWNKDTEQDKIPSKQKHRDHVLSHCQVWPKTQGWLCALLVKSSTEGHLGFHVVESCYWGNSIVRAAGSCTDIAIYFYLLALCWKRPFLLIQKKEQDPMSFLSLYLLKSQQDYFLPLPPQEATAQADTGLRVFSGILQHFHSNTNFDRQSNITFLDGSFMKFSQYNNFKSWEW